jgi:hypothetical protein
MCQINKKEKKNEIKFEKIYNDKHQQRKMIE